MREMLGCVGSSYESLTSCVYPTLVLHSKSASSRQLSTKPHCVDLPHRVRVPHSAPACFFPCIQRGVVLLHHARSHPQETGSRHLPSHSVVHHPRHPSALKRQTQPLLMQFFHSFVHLPRVSNLLPHTTPHHSGP